MTAPELAMLLGHSSATAQRYLASGTAAVDLSARGHADRRLHAALVEADRTARAARLAAYRHYHGTMVASASPLALALFAHEKLDLDHVARELRPDGDWPTWLVGASGGRVHRARYAGRKLRCNLCEKDDRDRLLHSGHVVRRWREPEGALGIRFSEHGLELGACVSGLHIRTLGDLVTMTTDQAVPETVKAALVGRRIGDVFEHPIMNDPAHVIVGVVNSPAEPKGEGGAWRLIVRVPRVSWRPPWARRSAAE
jgi:hypothetical protein